MHEEIVDGPFWVLGNEQKRLITRCTVPCKSFWSDGWTVCLKLCDLKFDLTRTVPQHGLGKVSLHRMVIVLAD